jgi:hypothetical protein
MDGSPQTRGVRDDRSDFTRPRTGVAALATAMTTAGDFIADRSVMPGARGAIHHLFSSVRRRNSPT